MPIGYCLPIKLVYPLPNEYIHQLSAQEYQLYHCPMVLNGCPSLILLYLLLIITSLLSSTLPLPLLPSSLLLYLLIVVACCLHLILLFFYTAFFSLCPSECPNNNNYHYHYPKNVPNNNLCPMLYAQRRMMRDIDAKVDPMMLTIPLSCH